MIKIGNFSTDGDSKTPNFQEDFYRFMTIYAATNSTGWSGDAPSKEEQQWATNHLSLLDEASKRKLDALQAKMPKERKTMRSRGAEETKVCLGQLSSKTSFLWFLAPDLWSEIASAFRAQDFRVSQYV
jgi:hypothetical protein